MRTLVPIIIYHTVYWIAHQVPFQVAATWLVNFTFVELHHLYDELDIEYYRTYIIYYIIEYYGKEGERNELREKGRMKKERKKERKNWAAYIF